MVIVVFVLRRAISFYFILNISCFLLFILVIFEISSIQIMFLFIQNSCTASGTLSCSIVSCVNRMKLDEPNRTDLIRFLSFCFVRWNRCTVDRAAHEDKEGRGERGAAAAGAATGGGHGGYGGHGGHDGNHGGSTGGGSLAVPRLSVCADVQKVCLTQRSGPIQRGPTWRSEMISRISFRLSDPRWSIGFH